MADFDIGGTRYEDFYLSNFRGKKASTNFKANNNVDIEIINVDDHLHDDNNMSYSNYAGSQSVYTEKAEYVEVASEQPKLEYNTSLQVVKTDVVRHKNLSCERCEPLTLQIALKGIEKNKQIKKEMAKIKADSCNKCNDKPNAKGRKKRPRSKKRKFAIVVLVVIFAFISCFLLADVLSSGYLIDSVVKKLFHGDVSAYYYGVEIATFSDVDSARVTSEEIRASGGSGYVVRDELYRVIAEVYTSEKDAESVSTNLNLAGYVTNIYVFKMEEINYNLFPTSVRNPTKSVMKYQEIMYKSLFDTAVKLEKQEIDYTSARETIAMLRNQINNMLIDYESAADKKVDDKYVQKVRMQISSMVGALDNLTAEGSKNDRLLSDIRYINSMTINTHRALINSLQIEG